MRVMADVFDDLPDGAFFAAMSEQGFEPEDLVELNAPSAKAHPCPVCSHRFRTARARNQHQRDKHLRQPPAERKEP